MAAGVRFELAEYYKVLDVDVTKGLDGKAVVGISYAVGREHPRVIVLTRALRLSRWFVSLTYSSSRMLRSHKFRASMAGLAR